MRRLRLTSIKNKLIAINLIVSVVIVTFCYVFFTFSLKKISKQHLIDNAVVQTKLISEYLVSPIELKDTATAEKEVLSKFHLQPEIIAAFVYDSVNTLFAKYNPFHIENNIEEYFKTDDIVETGNYITIIKPVISSNNQIGTVVVKVSTQSNNSLIKKSLYTSFGGALLLIFIGALLSLGLQRIISVPLLKLARFVRDLSKSGDYSKRIKKITSDEIGVLYEGFNDMLDQLYNREVERDFAISDLRTAKESAENADTLKTAFLTNMSHEIRTPMNAIIGFTTLLNEPDVTEEEKTEYLRLIRKSGNTLLQLIDDIIDISKIEAGEIKIRRVIVDVKKYVNDVYLKYSKEVQLLEDKDEIKIDIDDQLDGEKFKVYSDPIRLQQILDNLMSNAVKFTDKGSITVGCKLSNNSNLLFWVKDTGIGIGTKAQEIIFERFRKEEKDKTKVYRGTGLGLAISKSLIQMLGGTIWVESEKDKGSIFYFTHPVEPKVIEQERKVKQNKEQGTTPSLMNKKILVVEDEFSNFMYLKALLKKTGVEIIWARDGEEAVNFVHEGTFNLILMDVKMPKMNGYQATRIIKSKTDTPIIIQTAYAMPSEREESINAGCDAYISKPIKKEELLELIAKYV